MQKLKEEKLAQKEEKERELGTFVENPSTTEMPFPILSLEQDPNDVTAKLEEAPDFAPVQDFENVAHE